MENYISYINKICRLEKEVGIYDIRIKGVPIWMCVYRRYRDRYLEDNCGIPPMKNHAQFVLKDYIYSTLKSAIQYFRYLLSGKSVNNIMYGFARLEHIDNVYVDKFLDGIIQTTSINDSYLYLERGRSGKHMAPRLISNVVWLEFIDNLALIVGKIGYSFLYRKYRSEFNLLFSKANNILKIDKADKKYIIGKVGMDIIRIKLTKLLLKRLNAKRVFATTLRNKPYLIAAANSLNLPCYEIQHGITEGPTPMYSGEYIDDFSPTLFLAFGKTSMIPVFNVPMHKMINIGFKYKSILQSKISSYIPMHYLLISDPEITQDIVDVACRLSNFYPNYKFSIRFHPMEKASVEQIDELAMAGVEIASNDENSSLAVLKYEGVIGEKSTVLYEALSLGIKTAKLYFDKLNIGLNEKEELLKGFFLISKIEDFDRFKDYSLSNSYTPEFYSDFNYQEFDKLLK